jgi:phage baseplate assembly protein W
MSSLGVKLPIARDVGDGYGMIKSFKTMIKQNFKMLLLTHPGERVMEPGFGVGLKKYLFENFNESTFARIERDIIKQTKIYLPVVRIQEISFAASDPDTGQLSISIHYAIPNLNIQDLLEFTI